MKITLLIIDPDFDFIEPNGGSLYVQGSNSKMKKLSDWIKNRGLTVIDNIVTSQDAHNILHFGNLGNWVDEENKPFTSPGTQISYQMYKKSKAKLNPSIYNKDKFYEKLAEDYLKDLDKKGMSLFLWPIHSLDGSIGQAFPEFLIEAINDWSIYHKKPIHIIRKGQKIYRDMYSIFSYDIPDGKEKGPKEAQSYLKRIAKSCDKLLISGQAGDFCVERTIKDLLEFTDNNPKAENYKNKLIFITDTISFIDENNKKEIYKIAIEKYGAKEMTIEEINGWIKSLQ